MNKIDQLADWQIATDTLITIGKLRQNFSDGCQDHITRNISDMPKLKIDECLFILIVYLYTYFVFVQKRMISQNSHEKNLAASLDDRNYCVCCNLSIRQFLPFGKKAINKEFKETRVLRGVSQIIYGPPVPFQTYAVFTKLKPK